MKYIGFKHQRENKQNSDKYIYMHVMAIEFAFVSKIWILDFRTVVFFFFICHFMPIKYLQNTIQILRVILRLEGKLKESSVSLDDNYLLHYNTQYC